MYYFFMWSGMHKPKGDWIVAIDLPRNQADNYFQNTGYSYEACFFANSKEEAKELYDSLRCM